MLERMNKRKIESNEGRRMIQRKTEYIEIKKNIERRKKRRKKSGMNEENREKKERK